MPVMPPVFALILLLALTPGLAAQPAPAGGSQGPTPGVSAPAAPVGAAQRGGRRAVQIMALSSPAWPEGGRIPSRHTQAGPELSPPLTWSNVPDEVASFVLVVHDPHATVGATTDDVLHWMVWNIPGSATGLPEGVPHGNELPDGSRQISISGPYYRGPGAPAAGPTHDYVFELYALDIKLDIPAVGQSPAATRAAVIAAMAGHVRGKGAYVGLFKR